MNKVKKTTIMVILIYLILNLIVLPGKSIAAVQNAVALCINTVIPSLFPFFVVSSLFISLGFASYLSRFLSGFIKPVFNVNGAGALPIILGLISGYPIGASSCTELYKKGFISKIEAERLLAFTNNSGPLFILGAVGYSMLNSPEKGLIIYVSHILAAVLTGIIFRFYKYKNNEHTHFLPPAPANFSAPAKTFGSALGESMNYAVENMLKVCGFVILFGFICSCIPKTNLFPYIYSLFEITGGLNALSLLELDETFKLSIMSFFLSLSGLSVLCQVSSIIIPSGLSVKPYILGKVIQAVLSFYITKILLIYFQPYKTYSVFSPIYEKILPQSTWQASLSILFFAAIGFLILFLIGYALEAKRKK